MYHISLLSQDIIQIIIGYIPKNISYRLTKQKFIENCNDAMMCPENKRYFSYIRDCIRYKRDFIFKQLVTRDFTIWNSYHLYKFQNSTYNNYTNFLLQYA